MRRVYLILSLMVLMLLTGCGGGTVEPTEEAVATRPTGTSDLPPVIFLLDANSVPVPGSAGSWCWADTCVDMEAPPEITQFLPLNENVIRLRTQPPAPREYSVGLRSVDDPEFAISDTLIPDGDTVEWTDLDAPAGNYVLSVIGVWPDNQDVSYYFGVSLPGN